MSGSGQAKAFPLLWLLSLCLSACCRDVVLQCGSGPGWEVPLRAGLTVSLSADRKGAAVVVTSHPQLLPRWSSRSLLGEKLPAVLISDLLDSSPEAAQGLVPSATLQDKRGMCSSVWSLGFWGRQCCICTQLFSFPSACVSDQCWPLLSCSASPWP